MNMGEALSKAVTGYKVRHDGMAKGAFVHYEFDGWRLNGKPWQWDDEDKAADWYVIDAIIEPGKNWDIGAVEDIIVEDLPIKVVPAIEGWP